MKQTLYLPACTLKATGDIWRHLVLKLAIVDILDKLVKAILDNLVLQIKFALKT